MAGDKLNPEDRVAAVAGNGVDVRTTGWAACALAHGSNNGAVFCPCYSSSISPHDGHRRQC